MIIHVVDQRVGHVKRWEGHGGAVITSIDFGHNFLISSGYDRHVKKWDCCNDYECIGDWDHLIPDDDNQFVDHPQRASFRLKASPDSQTAVILLKGTLLFFDSSDGTVRQTISIGDGIYGASTPIFTPDAGAIIFGCGNSYGEDGDEPRSDGFLKIYSFDSDAITTVEMRRGEMRHEMVDGFQEPVDEFANDLAISRDGKMILSCGTELNLWRVVEGQLEFVRNFELLDDAYQKNDIRSVAFTPCERYLAVAGGEKYEENWGFLHFFSIDGKSHICYNFDVVIGSVRYSSMGTFLYTANNKTTINPKSVTHEEEDEN